MVVGAGASAVACVAPSQERELKSSHLSHVVLDPVSLLHRSVS